MGYYTRYEVETVGNPGMDFDMASLANGFSVEQMVSDFIGYDPFEDSCKWYDHDSNMLTFSKIYPNTVFKLSGVGEESPDLWVKYYQNGKVQASRATITYDAFDPAKLASSYKLGPRG